MSLTPSESRVGGDFPTLLKSWRHRRRLSQLDLALTSGVSQRHVSFLESGRARPSRGMILQLSETLDVPLRERNAWLMAAGFAPIFRALPLDDPQMNQVMGAVRMMLANHEPFPALAVDRAWNIRLANTAFERLSALLGEDLWRRTGGPERNLMRLMFHPAGIRPLITNWAAAAPALWRRAEREAEALGGGDIRAMLDELAPHQDAHTLRAAQDVTLAPGAGPRHRNAGAAYFAVHRHRHLRHGAGRHGRRTANREPVPGRRRHRGAVPRRRRRMSAAQRAKRAGLRRED